MEVNGQGGVTGAAGGEEGSGGRLGERGLLAVKKSWTVWCWRTWPGSAVRHLVDGHTDATVIE